MPVAIPANVKYEEKILGPFTLKQSLYVGGGVGLTLYIYLGSSLPFMVKMMLIGVVGLLSIGLAMFNLDVQIINYFNFFKAKKTTSWISPAARKLMDVKTIRADAVYLKDKRVLTLVKVRPINFGVLSDQDRDTVIYGFLEFLNALNFPVQLVMKSVNLDLNEYLAHLKRRILKRDDKIALAYYEHFEDYLKAYIKENKINDRLFYIVVPAPLKGDEKKILQNLASRCDQIIGTLSLSGLLAERMNTHQLINLYSSYFTETFELYENLISPITIYRKMWKESPQHAREKRMKAEAAMGGSALIAPPPAGAEKKHGSLSGAGKPVAEAPENAAATEEPHAPKAEPKPPGGEA